MVGQMSCLQHTMEFSDVRKITTAYHALSDVLVKVKVSSIMCLLPFLWYGNQDQHKAYYAQAHGSGLCHPLLLTPDLYPVCVLCLSHGVRYVWICTTGT